MKTTRNLISTSRFSNFVLSALRATFRAFLLAAASISLTSQTQAGLIPVVIFEETFDTPATGSAATALAYPDFTFVAPDVNVTGGGILEIDKSTTSAARFLTNDTFTNDTFTVRGFVGGRDSTSTGNVAVGLAVGNRGFTFFPGLGGGGAFRVVNPLNGSAFVSNTNMGFNPAQNVLHEMIVEADAISGILDVTVIDGVTAAEFNFVYDSSGAFVPGTVGFIEVYTALNTGMFDTLQVIELQAQIPEPSSCLLLGLGVLGLIRHTRRRRRRA